MARYEDELREERYEAERRRLAALNPEVHGWEIEDECSCRWLGGPCPHCNADDYDEWVTQGIALTREVEAGAPPTPRSTR